ncbi:MAG TPA: TRAP transporter small permease subunit [Steroidobacteraceae bacterium]|nr:TRAP transporter small permease subunit [Steroidobacteraceae bacterium]
MQSPKIPPTLLDKIVVWIGAAALVLLGLLITASVLLRAAGGVIKGNSEIGEMLIIIVASCALVTATFSDGHPHVHMLIDKLKSNWRTRVAIVVTALGALFWTATAWMNAKVAIGNAILIEETELLHIPLPPFRAVWIAALAIVAGLLIARIVRLLRSPPQD